MTGNERRGHLKSWNHGKGFGFIQPDKGGAEVFAHISVMRGERRPVAGDRVLYLEGCDERGRPRAEQMRLVGEKGLDRGKPRAASPKRSVKHEQAGAIANPVAKLLVLAALCVLPLWGCIYWQGRGVHWLLPLYVCASAVSFVQYWLDKRAARRGGRRTPENALHLVELAGGWPGALVAQQLLRHKTRKASYQAVFWLIVAVHQAFWIDCLLLDGSHLARHLPLFVE